MKVVQRINLFCRNGSNLVLVRLLGLVAVLAVGLIIRLIDLNDPPLDFFASRQLRSAIISRSYYYQFDRQADPILRDKALQLGDLEIYEPPILEALVGFTGFQTGQDVIAIGRIYNAFFWCLGGAAMFAAARRFLSFPAALTGLAFFLYLPFSVIASRSFQPDAWMVMWILVFYYVVLRWSEQPHSWKWSVLTGLAGSAALLVKLYSVFFVGPVMLAVFFSVLGLRGMFRKFQPWVAGLIALAPSLVYYVTNAQRSSDFFSFWVVSLSGLVLQTNFYADWLAMIKGLAGLTTLVAALVGVTVAERRLRIILAAAWVGYFLYGLTFPYQYVTHDYYHLPLVALIAFSIMPVIEVILQRLHSQDWIWKAVTAGVLLFACFYGAYVARSVLVATNYELEPASWKRVGDAIPEGKRFVALTADYGMRLNYYGWKKADDYWPSSGDLKLFSLSGSDPMDYARHFDQITAGKDYFLVTALSEYDAQPQLKEILTENYPVAVEGNGFIVYDLAHRLKE